MALALTLIDEWEAPLQDAATRVFAALQVEKGAELPDGTINLKLVDDTESARLNKEYTGNAYATDVLAFNYAEDGQETDGELADIAISRETAARQADQAKTALPDEIGLLVLHGLLHVLGYDHQDEASRQELDQLQQRILTAANLTYREFSWDV